MLFVYGCCSKGTFCFCSCHAFATPDKRGHEAFSDGLRSGGKRTLQVRQPLFCLLTLALGLLTSYVMVPVVLVVAQLWCSAIVRWLYLLVDRRRGSLRLRRRQASR